MLGKKRNFRSIRVFRVRKNKQKCVFVSNHETIVFQDMLVSPPTGGSEWGF